MKLLLLIKSIIKMRKLYYSISEVCQLIDEEQHILRYWEKEFPQLKPKKNRGGNRIYSEKDVFLISSIKKLLRDEKISLKFAKTKLAEISVKPLEENLFNKIINTGTAVPDKIKPSLKAEYVKIDSNITISREEAVELLSVLRRFSDILKKTG